jgi:hypothetical protein
MIAVLTGIPAPDIWFQVFFALAAYAVVRGIANLIAWIKKRRQAKRDAQK